MAEVEVKNANTNLEAARSCERSLTDALARLDRELEQSQSLDRLGVSLEAGGDIRVSDRKETSEIATRGQVVE